MSEIPYTPNAWLTTNSSLYFADRLLSGELQVNAYSIFDLSKVSECILLADKIMVMPGRATNKNELYSKLERAKVIEEVNLTATQTDEIVSSIHDSASYYYRILDKDYVAKIMQDIFPIRDRQWISQIIQNAATFSERFWNSGL